MGDEVAWLDMMPRPLKPGERFDEWPIIVIIDFGADGANYELKDVNFTYVKDSWNHPRITRQERKYRIDGVKGWKPGADLKIEATIVDVSGKKKSVYHWSTPLKRTD